MRITKKCYSCKQIFPKSELIDYVSPCAQVPHSYCSNCLADKRSREKFSDEVCKIFGIKNPGPRIWTERKRLQMTYGYTDDTIIDCLEYIYKVKNMKQFAESLCLVKPPMVEEMLQYKRAQQQESINLVRAMNTVMQEYIVPTENIKEQKKIEYNPDVWLDD